MEKLHHLLIVDDNAADVELLKLALRTSAFRSEVTVSRDGNEALEALRGSRVPPSLILTDLFMPKLGGAELLRILKNEPCFRHIPVIVLSGSILPGQLAELYAAGAHSVLEKCSDWDRFEKQLNLGLAFLLDDDLMSVS